MPQMQIGSTNTESSICLKFFRVTMFFLSYMHKKTKGLDLRTLRHPFSKVYPKCQTMSLLMQLSQTMRFLIQLKKNRILSRRDLLYRISSRSCKTDIKSIMRATKKLKSRALLTF